MVVPGGTMGNHQPVLLAAVPAEVHWAEVRFLVAMPLTQHVPNVVPVGAGDVGGAVGGEAVVLVGFGVGVGPVPGHEVTLQVMGVAK